MKDFGNEVYSGDCFVLVGLIMGLDSINTFHFIEIMKQIDCDLHLGLDENATERKFIKPVMAKVTPICCEQDLQQEKPFSYKQSKCTAILEKNQKKIRINEKNVNLRK